MQTIKVMNELIYFQFADLIVRLEYIQDTNSLRYASHRKLIQYERVIIEQYLLAEYAPKTDYYKKHPSFLVHTGPDEKLIKDFNLYKIRGKIKKLDDENAKAVSFANSLISESMKSYYFERIGDVLLEIKQAADEDAAIIVRSKLDELVQAYNVYADKKITAAELVKND